MLNPPELPDIRRTTSIQMLGVTLTNHLSVSDHVRDVISRCPVPARIENHALSRNEQ